MVLAVSRRPRRRQIALDVGGGAYRGARWDKAHSLHRPNHDRLSRCQGRRQERYIRDCGRDPRPRWVSSRRRLEWPNGAMCVCFSGEEPESLRGPQCELCIIDEIGRMRYQQAVFDTMMLGLRLGDKPRVLLATTPRTTPFMKRLVAMDDVRITTGSTYDNAQHLSADFLKKVRELYEGTRLGRQELQGAMILDPQNALFKDDWLIHNDVPEEIIEQVTVVDPSGGDDEVGIVAS